MVLPLDEIDWEALGRQFRQEDSLMKVVSQIGKAQGVYYQALIEGGFTQMDALKIVSITVKEVGEFARQTMPVLVQMFMDYRKSSE